MSVIQFDRNDFDSTRSPVISWRTIRLPIAALLLVAAAAKIQDITRILAGDGLLSSKPSLLSAIGIETALAIFLLIDDGRWSWQLAMAINDGDYQFATRLQRHHRFAMYFTFCYTATALTPVRQLVRQHCPQTRIELAAI